MPPKRPVKSNLPVPLQEGVILKDTVKKQWRLGRLIAQGGFGLIYLASPHLDVPVAGTAEHVIKVEYLENGPLFSELKFYQRAAKQEEIKKWMKRKQLAFLGIPVFWGSGQAEHNGKSYRFMVIDRLGEDLQDIFERQGRRFNKETVLQIGVQMLDVLEYIHENEYIHGDIKAANLLLGYRNPHEVYLADYGLSYRYCPNGNHKKYLENPKKGHNGTMEFTSIDAHKGVAPSRRGDLEILGYCMLQWMCGKLPWEQKLKNPGAVQAAKAELLDELPNSVTSWAPAGTGCGEIAEFLMKARDLQYDEKPNYELLKEILLSGLKHKGNHYNGPLDFTTAKRTLHERTANHKKAALPKQVKETKESGLNNKDLAYPRKATMGRKSSPLEDERMLARLNTQSQTEVVALPKQVKETKESGLNNKVLAYPRKATMGRKSSPVEDERMLARLNTQIQTEVAALPKQVKETKESGLKNKELAYPRKATMGRKSSPMEDERMLARPNTQIQTEVERQAIQRTHPKTFQKNEEKSIENGFTHSSVLTTSSARSIFQEQLYQYAIAIIVLLLLICLSLYFL